MSEFQKFNSALSANFNDLAKTYPLFVVDIDGDELWETYLSSFPDGTNPIFRVRREYDCNCCKNFIRRYGKVVAIKNNKLVSIWDNLKLDHPFNIVSEKLSQLIHEKDVCNVFLTDTEILGTPRSKDKHANIVWGHFNLKAPKKFIRKRDIDSELGSTRTARELFNRGLKELSLDAVNTVLDLIDQNSLYRGQEHRALVNEFKKHKIAYSKLTSSSEMSNYTWVNTSDNAVSRFKNSVIGTLVSDISEGMELDRAVSSFESKVAPTNYKRPTALITKAMIANAKKLVEELGIEPSLYRRHANLNDITINNLLFANRDTRVALNVFDEMSQKVSNALSERELSKIEEVPIADFLGKILPKVTSIQVSMENRLVGNLMSLIAPVYCTAPPILKWSNNFSWAYNGSLSDSIKEKVKSAGGNVNGVLRVSLAWYNYDDLDLHVIEPDGNRIHFSNKENRLTSGALDIDMNVSPTTRSAVENIVWTNKSKMLEGTYQVKVHNYTHRETVDVGFVIEVEYDGVVHQFNYDKMVKSREYVDVVTFTYSPLNGVRYLKRSVPESTASKSVWNINTNRFINVIGLSKSPNYWDENKYGNEHVFLYLEGCKNPDKIRGLFNEFLIGSLDPHRKVLEVLGNQLIVEPTDEQLSGLGFSLTKRDHFICKVSGSFDRVLKVII